MSTVDPTNSQPVSATQIPLPPSPAQSIREDEPTSHHEAASPADATGKVEEKTGPTVQQSWERLTLEVEKYDDGMVKNWRDDIDTLLVFAGLFSAVVTAFLIEAYQWLSEDPADITVVLLTQISMQLNTSQPIPLERPEFKPDASSIRINCFWFLSLVFSLTSALFGLLCKQWLREQQRDPPTTTPAEALGLRQMRRDSFEKWGVSPFLSVLPILLEVALLFFFVGILDLLWNRHLIPFAFCLVAVMLSAGLYFVTTFLPTLAYILWNRTAGSRIRCYYFICPYKSPQAWAVYYLSVKVLRAFQQTSFINSYTMRWFGWTRIPASDWSSLDLQVIRRSRFRSEDSSLLSIYELRAFQWAFTAFQDSPSMLPHLQNVLGTIPPSVAMSAVLEDWKFTMWRDIQKSDVDLRFSDWGSFWRSLDWYMRFTPGPTLRYPTLLHSEGTRLLYYHQYWQALASNTNSDTLMHDFDRLIDSITAHQAELQKLVNLRFVVPFTVVEKLWTHDDPDVQERSSRLLPFFEDAFSTHSGYDEERHDRERLAFISALTNHLDSTDFTSYVATSTCGQEFIRFVHGQIISRRLHEPHYDWYRDDEERPKLISAWNQVTSRVIEIGHLPAGYFTPIPRPSEESMAPATDAGIPLPITNPDHPREENEGSIPRSDHEVNDDGQGVPGPVERSEQGNGVGGLGADERV
ncbi:hypothetical protein Moror_4386 [Moniliophthora roreri MCA 2997]|uniref:DUF6535 domain-containing protein n=1 Tax=Moniliophthora roreri (strain MCA 2997) TaxID=1381753 RepID=V2XFT9_MONRO|nr:hypothetical protein Moror_4386 [Moniliophthora roreri MCA 2997]